MDQAPNLACFSLVLGDAVLRSWQTEVGRHGRGMHPNAHPIRLVASTVSYFGTSSWCTPAKNMLPMGISAIERAWIGLHRNKNVWW